MSSLFRCIAGHIRNTWSKGIPQITWNPDLETCSILLIKEEPCVFTFVINMTLSCSIIYISKKKESESFVVADLSTFSASTFTAKISYAS